MENKSNSLRCETADYGLALLKYMGLSVKLIHQDYMKKNWGTIYNSNDGDVITTITDFFGSIFPMMETAERRVYTTEFKNRRRIVFERIQNYEIDAKYQSGVLDNILKEQIQSQ